MIKIIYFLHEWKVVYRDIPKEGEHPLEVFFQTYWPRQLG